MTKVNFSIVSAILFAFSLLGSTIGCTKEPIPGPDKTFVGEGTGALQGAGAGAIVGFQVGAGTGPGAAVGAGFGAVAGAIQGMVEDTTEEEALKISRNTRQQRERAVAQEALADHYKRRMDLFPTRDIFPADLFFAADSVKMCPTGINLVKEIARMNKFRLPYSRIIVASYAKSVDPESDYAEHLTERRAREFVNQLTRAGLEPRRLETRSVIVDVPVVIDPMDDPTRYNQAIELIPIDR